MSMKRVFIDNLIPGKKYHVIESWDIENRPRYSQFGFNGIYVRRYPYGNGNITKVLFWENGRERTVNSRNEFYLLPQPMNPNFIAQINRNIEMPSNTETEEWIDDSDRIKMNKCELTLPEDMRYFISRY
jgi:hypothetical protein